MEIKIILKLWKIMKNKNTPNMSSPLGVSRQIEKLSFNWFKDRELWPADYWIVDYVLPGLKMRFENHRLLAHKPLPNPAVTWWPLRFFHKEKDKNHKSQSINFILSNPLFSIHGQFSHHDFMSVQNRRTTSAVALDELKRRRDLESLRKFLISEQCFPATKDPMTSIITMEELKKLARMWKLNERRNFWKNHSERNEMVAALLEHSEQNKNFISTTSSKHGGLTKVPSLENTPMPPIELKPSVALNRHLNLGKNFRNYCGIKVHCRMLLLKFTWIDKLCAVSTSTERTIQQSWWSVHVSMIFRIQWRMWTTW